MGFYSSSELNQMLEVAQAREMVAVSAVEPVPAVASLREIPAELKALPNWVWWRLENGTKVPFVAGSFTRKASSTDPSSWRTFEEVTKDAVITNEQGIGFVFRKEDGIVGIDLDGCRNPTTGELAPWADALVTELNSFTEVTPSQTGLHILVRGTLPEGSKHVFNLDPAVGYGDKVKIEVFDTARYFTVTGESLFDDETPVEECDMSAVVQSFEAVQVKHPASKAKEGKEPGAPNQPVQLERAEGSTVITTKRNVLMKGTIISTRPFIIERAGNSLTYPSQSEADFALVSLLATENPDPAWIDEQFRASSLMRDKWERVGESTIQKVLTLKKDVSSTAQPATTVSDAAVNWRDNFKAVGELELGDVRMLIDGFLPEGTTFIGALAGEGKTLFALSIAKALTTGQPFLGRFNVQETVPVLYLIPESGGRAFRKRCEAFQIPNDPGRFLCRTISEGGTLLLGDPSILEAVRVLKPVVILDTVIRFSESEDENQAMQNKQLVNDILALRNAGATAVIGLHHATKAMRQQGMTLESALRGTGDIAASADAVYGLLRDELVYREGRGPNEVEVRCLKPRDFEPPTPFRIAASREAAANVIGIAPGIVSVIDEKHDFAIVTDDVATASNDLRTGEKLVELVKADPMMTVTELSEATDVSTWVVRKMLKDRGYEKPKGGKGGTGPWAKSVQPPVTGVSGEENTVSFSTLN